MNIICAVLTGKNFKRPDGDWIENTYNPKTCLIGDPVQLGLTLDDVIATDWETKPKITLTEEQFDEACKRITASSRVITVGELLKELKTALGI